MEIQSELIYYKSEDQKILNFGLDLGKYDEVIPNYYTHWSG